MGETPIVDATNTAANTRVRREEFEKLPVGRSYQALIGAVPGVVGTGNVNALGALTSNNLFIIDAVDTTDPTTGTFGTNLNFEAIQEVSVYTSGASAEYGRAQGAIVNVITKSGTNRFEGSAKYIFPTTTGTSRTAPSARSATRRWRASSSTRSTRSTRSLAAGRSGGIARGSLARTNTRPNTTAQRQTQGQIPEDYQQATENKFLNIRGTVQLAEGQTAWVKYYRSPTDGFVDRLLGRDDTGRRARSADRAGSDARRTARRSTAACSGTTGRSKRRSPTTARSSYVGDLRDERPSRQRPDLQPGRQQVLQRRHLRRLRRSAAPAVQRREQLVPHARRHAATTSRSASTSRTWNRRAEFKYPNAQYLQRRELQPGNRRRTSRRARRLRDRRRRSRRATITRSSRATRCRSPTDSSSKRACAGSSQTGDERHRRRRRSTPTSSPRACRPASTLTGDGKTLLTGSYGRYYASIIQGFSDSFANVPQQENYDLFLWNGSQYVFSRSVRVGGGDFTPNTDLKPYHMDEVTVGFQRQFGRTWARGVRFIAPQLGRPDRRHPHLPAGRLDRPPGRELRRRRARLQRRAVHARAPLLEQLERAGQLHLLARPRATTSATTSRRSATTSTRSAGRPSTCRSAPTA